jgi:hypothetical protein
MLTNFLEHTRCPEDIVSSILSQSQSAPERGDTPTAGNANGIAGNRPPFDPLKLLRNLQSPVQAPGQLYSRLSEFDNAIGVLRMEKYVDNSTSSENHKLLKLLVRRCYYALRPLFPVSFRKHLQRIALRGWDAKPFPVWPVDLTTEKLMEGIWQQLLTVYGQKELPFIWFWPDDRTSCCIMTHDVETHVGRDFCKRMMEMEKLHGISSAFEIVPEERYEVPVEYLQEIRDGGCEVCLHGLNHDGHLFSSESLFLARSKKINAYAKSWGAVGFRSPVMYRNLEWLHALQFSYDMSVPNVAHLDPQHGGCCTVMPYFIGDILELPLTTTQDYSLFHILQQRTLDLWKKQIEMIREKHGLLSFIIHPDYVNEQWSSEFYDSLLGYLAELRSNHAVWIALPREVDDWWRARRKMKLIQNNGTWKICGTQAGRARVAYASLQNGQVVYRVDKAGAAGNESKEDCEVATLKSETP